MNKYIRMYIYVYVHKVPKGISVITFISFSECLHAIHTHYIHITLLDATLLMYERM